MPHALRLLFVEDNVSAIADLLEDAAPETCRIIAEHLPLEGRTVHGMYSGPELFIRTDHLPEAPPENQVHRALPGDVGFWYSHPGRYASSPGQACEIVFIYNRGAAIMGPDGQTTWVNLFARIRDECSDGFYTAARQVRTEGPKTLRIELADQ
jgi:hypothetical protein